MAANERYDFVYFDLSLPNDKAIAEAQGGGSGWNVRKIVDDEVVGVFNVGQIDGGMTDELKQVAISEAKEALK